MERLLMIPRAQKKKAPNSKVFGCAVHIFPKINFGGHLQFTRMPRTISGCLWVRWSSSHFPLTFDVPRDSGAHTQGEGEEYRSHPLFRGSQLTSNAAERRHERRNHRLESKSSFSTAPRRASAAAACYDPLWLKSSDAHPDSCT